MRSKMSLNFKILKIQTHFLSACNSFVSGVFRLRASILKRLLDSIKSTINL